MPVLQERQNNSDQKLKRNKTFTDSANQNGNPKWRRHRRGTKGRYTVPLLSSAPSSPMVNEKYDPLLTVPLYIQTSHQGIYEDAPKVDRKKIPAISAEKSKRPTAVTSPKSTTSSSGFGSAHSNECSPKSTGDNQGRTILRKTTLHFWLLLCVQFVVYYFKRFSLLKRKKPCEEIRKTNEEETRIRHDIRTVAEPTPEPVRKPFYTELHLGRKNKHYTTMAALEADRLQYPCQKLSAIANETKYVTTVFEIRQRGLEELADSVREEFENWLCQENGDQNLIVVCYEMQWSTPDAYRNIAYETRMKNDLMRCLRSNNRRVCQTLAKGDGKNRYLLLPDSVTEEKAGRRPSMSACFGGSYRRYYSGLIPWAHRETADEHKCWWDFDPHSMPDTIKWPLIAAPQKTTVVLLNFISLKLGQL